MKKAEASRIDHDAPPPDRWMDTQPRNHLPGVACRLQTAPVPPPHPKQGEWLKFTLFYADVAHDDEWRGEGERRREPHP